MILITKRFPPKKRTEKELADREGPCPQAGFPCTLPTDSLIFVRLEANFPIVRYPTEG